MVGHFTRLSYINYIFRTRNRVMWPFPTLTGRQLQKDSGGGDDITAADGG